MQDLDEMASVDVFIGGVSSFTVLAGMLNYQGIVILDSYKFVSSRAGSLKLNKQDAENPINIDAFNVLLCRFKRHKLMVGDTQSRICGDN